MENTWPKLQIAQETCERADLPTLDTVVFPVNHSVMGLAEIQIEVQKLKPSERAALIEVLWKSLDEARINEVEAKWAAESEERIDAFGRGELPAVDGPSAMRELRSSLKK